MLTTNEIQEKVWSLGAKINAPKSMLIVYSEPVGDGSGYIVIDNNQYHIIYSERGYEIFRQTTEDVNELLYWIMESVASQMASEYELKNRNDENKDRYIAAIGCIVIIIVMFILSMFFLP
ncbi:Imm63 family immunity protein [Photorhabdus heterorhabditis]|uniref:Immunity protein 63 domain-containing protein n=1 Tax=Photorhabdus heterorhabditis TaxID=880156 RepID=A0A5B0V8T7_9GAMM|nr:Imm63 family immunity protein [Photorhabdus heterorhabditis]KAA1170957.1 hypothetical protein F0L16_21895 [Photorhabdus heterorhabditis]